MKKLSVYSVVFTAILLVLSITFLQFQLRDAKTAREEEPEIIEVASNDVVNNNTDTQIEMNTAAQDTEESIVDEFETVLDDSEEEPDWGEVHDSIGLVPTPINDNLPKDVYNTNYDTEVLGFYQLDESLGDSAEVSPILCKKIIDGSEYLSKLVREFNMKPWYVQRINKEFSGTCYYLFFRNCNAVVYIYDEEDTGDFKVGEIIPADKIEDGWYEDTWDRPLIIYKYLSRYDVNVMEEIESQLQVDDFGYNIWWTNYQLGDDSAAFWNIEDEEFKYPVNIDVSAWR